MCTNFEKAFVYLVSLLTIASSTFWILRNFDDDNNTFNFFSFLKEGELLENAAGVESKRRFNGIYPISRCELITSASVYCSAISRVLDLESGRLLIISTFSIGVARFIFVISWAPVITLVIISALLCFF